jgi:hypothetical protein
MGRVGEQRATSTQPVCSKVVAGPVNTAVAFFFSPPESTGYPSTIFAPRSGAKQMAASCSCPVQRRMGFARRAGTPHAPTPRARAVCPLVFLSSGLLVTFHQANVPAKPPGHWLQMVNHLVARRLLARDFADFLRRDAAHDRQRRHIFRHHCAARHHGPLADAHPVGDDGP